MKEVNQVVEGGEMVVVVVFCGGVGVVGLVVAVGVVGRVEEEEEEEEEAVTSCRTLLESAEEGDVLVALRFLFFFGASYLSLSSSSSSS